MEPSAPHVRQDTDRGTARPNMEPSAPCVRQGTDRGTARPNMEPSAPHVRQGTERGSAWSPQHLTSGRALTEGQHGTLSTSRQAGY